MVYHQGGRLDATFAALADPTRRALVARLARGERSIKELASRFTMSLPAVSKHVRVLERAGLAHVRRAGRSRICRLDAAPMRSAVAWMDRYRLFWEEQFDQLEKYLRDHPVEEDQSWPASRNRSSSRSRSVAPSPRRGTGSSRRGRGRTS